MLYLPFRLSLDRNLIYQIKRETATVFVLTLLVGDGGPDKISLGDTLIVDLGGNFLLPASSSSLLPITMTSFSLSLDLGFWTTCSFSFPLIDSWAAKARGGRDPQFDLRAVTFLCPLNAPP